MKTVTFFHSARVLVATGLIALSSLAVSCKDNDDAYNAPSFTIENTLINEPKEGQEVQVKFSTNRDWTVTSNADWVSVSPTSGKPGETFSIKALPNAGGERTATLLVKYGTKEVNLTVKQAGGANAEQPATFSGMPLADFIKKYDTGSDVIINDDVRFQAVVISDTQANNVPSLKNITVQAEHTGISVRLNANNTFKPGEVLEFSAKGAKVTRFRGGLQIDYTGINDGIKTTGTTQQVSPIKATLSDIYAGKYENVLVTVEGVQFKRAGGKLNTSNNKPFFHHLTDCVTEAPENINGISVAISSHFPEKETAVSDKNGSITGIIAKGEDKGKTVYNLWIRNLSDMNLTGTACTAKSEEPKPATPAKPEEPKTPATPAKPEEPKTPTTPATSTGGELFFSAIVDAKGQEKYIQIYNPQDKEVNLSGYSVKLDAYGKNGQPAKEKNIFNLKGTIPAHGFFIIKNPQASSYSGTAEASTVTFFNGDDNIALFKGDVLIDVVGTWGTRWLNSENKPAAEKVSLHRKASVTKANPSYNEAEWERVSDNAIALLGKR